MPPEIQAVKEERAKFTTAYINWTLDHGDYQERFEVRIAAHTRWERNLGDQNGFHPKTHEEVLKYLKENGERWKQTEEMHAFKFKEPQHQLLYNGKVWTKQGSSHWALTHEPYAWDPALGLEDWGLRPHSHINDDMKMENCVSTLSGTQRVITCGIQGDSKSMEWVLDTEKGSQPISATLRAASGLAIARSQTKLANVDGRWMPSSVEFFKREDEEPYQVQTVQEASFDQDWHRQEPYDPNDLDMGFGHWLGGLKYWDGASVIGRKDLDRLKYLYDVPLHPDVIEKSASFEKTSVKDYLAKIARNSKQYKLNHAEEYAELLKKRSADEKDEWDAYTDQFVAEHKLGNPKAAVAGKILAAAKKLRNVYRDKQTVSSEKARYDAIEKRIFDRLLVRNLKRLAR